MTPEQDQPQAEPERKPISRWENLRRHDTGEVKPRDPRSRLILECFPAKLPDEPPDPKARASE